MKKLVIVAVLVLTGFIFTVEANTNIHNRVGGYFYSSLTPYGSWIDIGYGTVAWKPTIMTRNWSPYYSGRWIWTDYGWYWDSYEPFGHVVYHYGRWYMDDYYGWIWVPDYEWAPAWVEWRYDDNYIGWAPLSPYATFSISVGIRNTHKYHVPYSNWHYINVNRFCDPYITNYYVSSKAKYKIHKKTKYRTNYGYHNGRVRNDGIDVGYIEKRSGQRINKRDIISVNDPRSIRNESSRDRDQIRTFYMDRDELSRENTRDLDVKRSDRKSSLDISKVELTSTRNLDRDQIRKERNVEDNSKINRSSDENKNRNERNASSEIERNKVDRNQDSRNTEVERNRDKNRKIEESIKRDRTIEQNKEREVKIKKDQESRNEELRKNNEKIIRQREEVKRNDRSNEEEREVNRSNSREIQKDNSNVERRKEPVQRNETRNSERKENRRDNSNDRETNERKSSDSRSRERTR